MLLIEHFLLQSTEHGTIECPLCLAEFPVELFPVIQSCNHRSCYDCFQQYLKVEISESRVNIACPECSEPLHPNGKPKSSLFTSARVRFVLETLDDFSLKLFYHYRHQNDSKWPSSAGEVRGFYGQTSAGSRAGRKMVSGARLQFRRDRRRLCLVSEATLWETRLWFLLLLSLQGPMASESDMRRG